MKLTPEQIDLLDGFCRFAEHYGYLDCDWWAEEPKLIDRFKEFYESLQNNNR